MKIISTVWNLFDVNKKEWAVSRNGGSIMIHDICEYIGRKEESYVYTGNMETGDGTFGHIHVLGNGKYLPETRDDMARWQLALQKRFKEILREMRPDFVLVQGLGEFSINCINACNKVGVAYAMVDHLYIGKGKDAYTDEASRRIEQATFCMDGLRVIAVGEAMGTAIRRDYQNLRSVSVIPNGTGYKGEYTKGRIFVKYKRDDKKVLLCSGSLHPRKNQRQIVRAFQLLPDDVKKNTVVLFCGKDSIKTPTKEILLYDIKKAHLEEKLLYIGTFSTEEMKQVYSVADGLIMASLSEGLSLVALEMMTYGKPVIMFEDNETAGDINDGKAVVFAKDHSDQALADAITEWYEHEWDEDYIKEYVSYYSMERVADDYINYCRNHMKNVRDEAGE